MIAPVSAYGAMSAAWATTLAYSASSKTWTPRIGPKYSVVNTSSVGSVLSRMVGCTKYPSELSASPPVSTRTAGRDLARARASTWVANAARSMTAPMNRDRSAATSPMASDWTAETNWAPIRFHTEPGTYAREAAEHFWP